MAASNLTLRLATAAVALPPLLYLLFRGPAWAWLVLILVVSIIAALELFSMTHPRDRVAQCGGVALTLMMVLALWFGLSRPVLLLGALLILPIASMSLVLARLGQMESAALRMASSSFGPLLLGGGLGSIALLKVQGGADGPAFVFLCMGLAWFGDTGGYFAGRAFGKRKLYERVSPKKTVEGAIGGILTTILGALLMRFVALPSLPILDTVLLGLTGSILGMLGDLGESVLKRSVGVKDSGSFIPGHGGILDRIDALLLTGPLTLLYVLLLR